ncbi:MAG: ferritin [Clostridiales bacterium]|nr:ferritin [Candidatus Crickella caballi]
MLANNIRELLIRQVNEELYSAYLYLGFVNNLKTKGLDGFAHWYKIQIYEEIDHAMLFRDYLINCNETVELMPIETEDVTDLDVSAILIKGLKHEEHVTDLINTIYNAVADIRDFRTKKFLDWFVNEQAEEEVNALELLTKFELYGTEPHGLYLLNNELGERQYEKPSLVL